MKTNLMTVVASLTFLVSAACSAPPTEGAESTSEGATSASSGEASNAIESAAGAPYVLVERSAFGYVLTSLNSGATSHVTALDLSAAGAQASAITSALATPGALAARGTIRDGDTLVVSDLYRALPRTKSAEPAPFYRAHVSRSGVDSATEVNVGKIRAFHALDVSGAADRFVDQPWLSARVLDGAALVSGTIASGVLHANAVFVRVPEIVTCLKPIEACGGGTLPTYERDANRCLVPSGCVHPAMCPMYIPACEPGYLRTSWPGPHGCSAFACDPIFDPAP